MRKAAKMPASIVLRPIDDDARDGRFQLVFRDDCFAVARAVGDTWLFGCGHALDFEPTHYHEVARS